MRRRNVLALLFLCGAASAASGVVVTLGDFNSTADFDLNAGGQFNWTVDGVDHLFNQRFFYRASAMADEAAVDSLPLTGAFASDTNPFDDVANDSLATRYSDAGNGLEVRINYMLRGTNAGTADLAETIRITNTGQSSTTLSFFQYVDFDLSATAGGDFGRIINGRVAQQADFGGPTVLSETVVTPAPDRFEMDSYPNILAKFSDGLATNLSNTAGPVFGDVTWAFQWDITLGAGQEFVISKDKLITIPGPGALALLGVAGLSMGRRRR